MNSNSLQNKERKRAQEIEFQFNFVDKEATRFDFQIKIKTKNQEAERELIYDQLREIDRVLKPHNAEASSLFPVFQLWADLPDQPQTEDLERFKQV
jgi:hypothetical protein